MFWTVLDAGDSVMNQFKPQGLKECSAEAPRLRVSDNGLRGKQGRGASAGCEEASSWMRWACAALAGWGQVFHPAGAALGCKAVGRWRPLGKAEGHVCIQGSRQASEGQDRALNARLSSWTSSVGVRKCLPVQPVWQPFTDTTLLARLPFLGAQRSASLSSITWELVMLVAGWFEASLGLNAEIEDLGSTYPSFSQPGR